MSAVAGTLSDGKTLRALSVTLEFFPNGRLLVRGEGVERDLALADIRVSDRLGSIARFLYLPDNVTLETLENDVVDAALVETRRDRAAGLIHFLETRSAIAAVATVLLIASVGSGLYFGLPRLARRVAFAAPPAIEAEAGRAALAAISQRLAGSRLSRSQHERVVVQLRRLLPERKEANLPRLEFRTMGDGAPNAFALPGNIILVSDELITLAADDEIAAVLAHELGHLEKRHGLQSALRGSFALLFVTSITGDLSTLTSFAGAIPIMLLQNGYSREFEREADVFARDLLTAREIPLNSFSSMLRKLEESRPGNTIDFSYLSTHPSTDERVKLFEVSEEPVDSAPVEKER